MSMQMPATESALFGYLDDVTRQLVLNTPYEHFLEWESLPLIKMATDKYGSRFWDDLTVRFLGKKTDKEYPKNREDFLAQVREGTLANNATYEYHRQAISSFRNEDALIRSQPFAWETAFHNFDNYIKNFGAIGAYEAIFAIREFLNLPDVDSDDREYLAIKGIHYLNAFSQTFFSVTSTLSFAAEGMTISAFKEIGIDFETNAGQLAIDEFIKPIREGFLRDISPKTIAAWERQQEGKENRRPAPNAYTYSK